jgi:hypothetical protein
MLRQAEHQAGLRWCCRVYRQPKTDTATRRATRTTEPMISPASPSPTAVAAQNRRELLPRTWLVSGPDIYMKRT